MKFKPQYIVYIVFIVILLMMRFCSPDNTVVEEPIIERYTFIDTTVVPGIPDTIPFYDTIPVFVNVEVNVPIYDTIKNLNIYDNKFEDSLISGYIHSEVDGTLVWQNFTYTPKFPKYIKQTDTLIINKTDSIVVTKTLEERVKFYAGFELGGNTNSFTASPKISLVDKKFNQYSIRYDLIGKTINLGFQKQIKFKK